MNQPLQPQLLKLEDALEEARRAGTTIPDQLQQAILLKCVSVQLRTHLNLAIQDTTSFKDLREHVLKWDRSQQKWAGLLFSSEDTSAAVPMEVDRVHGGGKKGGKGKVRVPNHTFKLGGTASNPAGEAICFGFNSSSGMFRSSRWSEV